jgi:hypothetical protein
MMKSAGQLEGGWLCKAIRLCRVPSEELMAMCAMSDGANAF